MTISCSCSLRKSLTSSRLVIGMLDGVNDSITEMPCGMIR